MSSNQQYPASDTNLSQCLREKKQDILKAWEDRIRQELPAAEGQSDYSLRDSLPAYLDSLADSLSLQTSKHLAMFDFAKEHARQRTAVENYTLDQVQLEYSILRKVIFETLETCAVLRAQDRDIILDYIIEGQMAATNEYVRIINNRLKMSEERLALALRSATMGTFDWEIQTDELTWSDTMIALFGFKQG